MKCCSHLFLDLESTLVKPVMNGWAQIETINEKKVKAFIADYKPDSIHVFSYALSSQFERQAFNLFAREKIERIFGIKFSIVPTTDDILAAGGNEIGDKQDSFKLYVQHIFRDSTLLDVALLDDMVYNETFTIDYLRLFGRIVNIDQLEEPDAIT